MLPRFRVGSNKKSCIPRQGVGDEPFRCLGKYKVLFSAVGESQFARPTFAAPGTFVLKRRAMPSSAES
jgi:hypothetical protein